MVSIKMANGTIFMCNASFKDFSSLLEAGKDKQFLAIKEFTNGIFKQNNVILQISQISSISEIEWGGKSVFRATQNWGWIRRQPWIAKDIR